MNVTGLASQFVVFVCAIIQSGVSATSGELQIDTLKLSGVVQRTEGKPIKGVKLEAIGVRRNVTNPHGRSPNSVAEMPTESVESVLATKASDERGVFELNVPSNWPLVVILASHQDFDDAYLNLNPGDAVNPIMLSLRPNRGMAFVESVLSCKQELRRETIQRQLRETAGATFFVEQAFPRLRNISSELEAIAEASNGEHRSEDVLRCEVLIAYAALDNNTDNLAEWMTRIPVDNRDLWGDKGRGTIATRFPEPLSNSVLNIAGECGAPADSKAKIIYSENQPTLALISLSRPVLMMPTAQIYERWHIVVKRENADWKVVFWRHLENSGILAK